MQRNSLVNWISVVSDLVQDLTREETASVFRSIFVQYTGTGATLTSADWASQTVDLELKTGMWVALDEATNQIVPISNDDKVLADAKAYTDAQIEMALQGRYNLGVVSSITTADANTAVSALDVKLRPEGKSFAYEIENNGTVDGVAYEYGGKFIGTVQPDGSVVWKGLIDDRVPTTTTLDTTNGIKALTGQAMAERMAALANVITQSASNLASLNAKGLQITALESFQKFISNQTNFTEYADSAENTDNFTPSSSLITASGDNLSIALTGSGLADGAKIFRFTTTEGVSFKASGNVTGETFTFDNTSDAYDYIANHNVSAATLQVAVQDAFDADLYDTSTVINSKIATAKAEAIAAAAADATTKADAAEINANIYTDSATKNARIDLGWKSYSARLGSNMRYHSKNELVEGDTYVTITLDNTPISTFIQDATAFQNHVQAGNLSSWIDKYKIDKFSSVVNDVLPLRQCIVQLRLTDGVNTKYEYIDVNVSYNIASNTFDKLHFAFLLKQSFNSEDFGGATGNALTEAIFLEKGINPATYYISSFQILLPAAVLDEAQEIIISEIREEKEDKADVTPFTVTASNYVRETGTITLPYTPTNILSIKVQEPVATGNAYLPVAQILEIEPDGTNLVLKVPPYQNWTDTRLYVKGR